MPDLLQNPPVSIALPNVGILGAEDEVIADTVGDYTSGKVVEDYIAENYLTPLRDSLVKGFLLWYGVLFVLVGLILVALNSNAGKTVIRTVTK